MLTGLQKIPEDNRPKSIYSTIKQEYEKVIENITRDKHNKIFIGGLPITLERKDILNILSKDIEGNYRYSVTQKVDGTRLLLFASYEQDGLRNISFIDRNNDFYTLKNSTRENLPGLERSCPKLLIDGELLAFNDEGKVISPNDSSSEIKMFSFMAFDILYGPIEIEYSKLPNQEKLTIGSEGAMAGPVGGGRWSYQKRYDILYKLLVPDEKNNFKPPLSLAFKNCQWFVPEIKPLYYINVIEKESVLYNNNRPLGFFQKNLIEFRKEYYQYINDKVRCDKTTGNDPCTKNKNRAIYHDIILDGLIFTPFDTEYVILGTWKKFKNIQYKWKPLDQQSIDFLIFKEETNYSLKIKKGNSLEIFNEKPTQPAQITQDSIQSLNKLVLNQNQIGEFSYDVQQKKMEVRKIKRR